VSSVGLIALLVFPRGGTAAGHAVVHPLRERRTASPCRAFYTWASNVHWRRHVPGGGKSHPLMMRDDPEDLVAPAGSRPLRERSPQLAAGRVRRIQVKPAGGFHLAGALEECGPGQPGERSADADALDAGLRELGDDTNELPVEGTMIRWIVALVSPGPPQSHPVQAFAECACLRCGPSRRRSARIRDARYGIDWWKVTGPDPRPSRRATGWERCGATVQDVLCATGSSDPLGLRKQWQKLARPTMGLHDHPDTKGRVR